MSFVFRFVMVAAVLFLGGNFQLAAQDGKDAKNQALTQDQDSEKTELDVSDELKNQIADYFDELKVAFADEDGLAIAEQFSLEDLVRSAEDRGIADFGNGNRRRQMMRGMRAGFNAAARNWRHMAWDSHDIRDIDRIAPDQFAVYVRNWHDEIETYSKIRWWLVKTDADSFKIYDLQDFDQGLRVSSIFGAAMAAIEGKKTWVDPFQQLVQAFQQSDPEEFIAGLDAHQRLVESILNGDPPTEIKNFVMMLQASHQISVSTEESCQEAVEITEKMIQDGNPPIAHYLQGNAWMVLEEYEEAIKTFEIYAEMLDWDADTYESVSDCYRSLGKIDQAIESATLGLKDNARSWGCLVSLSMALPKGRWDELKPHFEKLDYDEGALECVIDWAIDSDGLELAQHIFAWLKQKHPQSDLIEYYEEVFAK